MSETCIQRPKRDQGKTLPRLLVLLGVPPGLTGSGVVVLQHLRRWAARGYRCHACFAACEPVEAAVLGLDPGIEISTVTFRDPDDPGTGESRVSFPIPAYSDGMPFCHTRYCHLTQAQWEEYLEQYKAHLRPVISSFRPDVVHVHHLGPLNRVIQEIAPWLPIVCSTHGVEQKMAEVHRSSFDELVVPWLRRIDRVLSLTPAVTAQTQSLFEIDPRRMEELGNGYDQGVFRPRRESGSAILGELGMPRDPGKLVVYVGKYSRWKGIDYLIRAASHYGRDRGGERLTLIVGKGPQSLKREYERLIRGLGLEDEVVLLDRHLEISQHARLLNAADVFVLPSLAEPFGLALLEALGCGCRTVAARCGGPEILVSRELIERHQAILVDPPWARHPEGVDPQEAEEYARRLGEAVSGLLSNPLGLEERRAIAQTVEERSWERVGDRMERIYEEVIEQRRERDGRGGLGSLAVFLSSPGAFHAELVGSKAVGLAELAGNAGVSVPEGVILTTEVFARTIRSHEGLGRAMERLDAQMLRYPELEGDGDAGLLKGEILGHADRISRMLGETEIVGEGREALRGALEMIPVDEGNSWQVRSSAVGEDSKQYSWAGQFRSVAVTGGVEEILEGIKEVYASAYSREAVSYRLQVLKDEGRALRVEGQRQLLVVKMAVMVQRRVDSSLTGARGTVYTLPRGRETQEIFIECLRGAGREAFGESQPDVFRYLGRPEGVVLIQESIQPKLDLRLAEQLTPALSREEGWELAATVFSLLRKPGQGSGAWDLEFVVDRTRRLHWVQKRPLTRTAADPMRAQVKGVPLPMAVEETERVLLSGRTGYPGAVSGRLLVINRPGCAPEHDNLEWARTMVQPGDVVCTPTVNIGWTILFDRLGGLIVERGGVTSHSAAIARERGVPAVVGAQGAGDLLSDWHGGLVTLDAQNRVVFSGEMPLETAPLQGFWWRDLETPQPYSRREPSHYIDTKGKEWARKPVCPLGPLQLALYEEAMKEAGRLFEGGFLPMQVKNGVLYVGYEELLGLADAMYEQGLGWNEDFFRGRVRTVKEFVRLAQSFEPDASRLEAIFRCYTHMIMHFHVRAGFRRRVVLRLREEWVGRLPGSVRVPVAHFLSVNAPVVGSMTRERDREYRIMLAGLSHEQRDWFAAPLMEKRFGQAAARFPDVWQQCVAFLENYRLERCQLDDWSYALPMELLFTTIQEDLRRGLDREPMPGEVNQSLEGYRANLALFLEELSQEVPAFDWPAFGRILVLSEEQALQVEEERHLMHRWAGHLRKELLRWGETLHQEGRIHRADQVLSLKPRRLLELAKRTLANDRAMTLPGILSGDVVQPSIDAIELHPTNDCNLSNLCCKDRCTYADTHEEGLMLPFEQLDLVARMGPSYIFIVGGGEPTRYRYQGKDLTDVITRLRELLPEVSLTLVTNGMRSVSLVAQRELSSIRISYHGYRDELWEAGDRSQAHLKPTWKHTWQYFAEGPIGEVWVLVRFDRENFLQVPLLTHRLWCEWRRLCRENPLLSKKEFGVKPLYLADDSQPGHPYHAATFDESHQKMWCAQLERITEQDPEFGSFLRGTASGLSLSNFSLPAEMVQGKLLTPSSEPMEQCWLAGDYAIVAADGKIYPCCSVLTRKEFSYGHLIQPLDGLAKKRRAMVTCSLGSCHEGCRLMNTHMGHYVKGRMEDRRERAKPH